ncbi:MAG: hypothetical protein U0174_16910 [Polyangiaceae bacterium]
MLILCLGTALVSLGAACLSVPSYSLGPEGGGQPDDSSFPDAGAPPDGGTRDAQNPDGKTVDATVPYRMFVTSEPLPANFRVLPNTPRVRADEHCNNAVRKAKLTLPGRTWRAYLWDDSLTTPSAYIVPVADGWHKVLGGGDPGALLVDKLPTDTLLAVVSDENGIPGSASMRVWTGGSDQSRQNTCENWTSASNTKQGNAGQPDNLAGVGWLNHYTLSCDSEGHFYCFEQPAP